MGCCWDWIELLALLGCEPISRTIVTTGEVHTRVCDGGKGPAKTCVLGGSVQLHAEVYNNDVLKTIRKIFESHLDTSRQTEFDDKMEAKKRRDILQIKGEIN